MVLIRGGFAHDPMDLSIIWQCARGDDGLLVSTAEIAGMQIIARACSDTPNWNTPATLGWRNAAAARASRRNRWRNASPFLVSLALAAPN
jgi:hypothetical protein